MSNNQRQRDAERDEMRPTRARRSRADLEHLLDGRPARPDVLAELLTAARTSGGTADTAGLGAAMAAFASVSPDPTTPESHRRPSMMKTMAAKLLAAKLLVLGGAAVAATAGGVAFAASTGHLPSPLPHSSHAAPAGSTHANQASASASESEKTSGTQATDSAKPTHSATPSPSLVGLCHSWLARPHLNGQADTNPAFTALVTAAGGVDSVNGYCTTLLSSSTPHPTGKPSDAPGDPSHSTGKPSTLPAPSSHPGGH